MNTSLLKYVPIEGKTYSLFGNNESTREYYEMISSFTDKILIDNDINEVLRTIQKYSARRHFLKKIASDSKSNSLISFCLNIINSELKQFTKKTNEHLNNLPFFKFRDRRLATTEEQYHLYMVEIELTNRLNKNLFLQSKRKISLQPYCLRDLTVECKSENTGFDFQCRFCSKSCFQNHASRILKENEIAPYIWINASIGDAAREARKYNKTFGILGIACIPELVWGMRKCMKYKIPVVGLPLNANRCSRWFGDFYDNSIDLDALESLVKV